MDSDCDGSLVDEFADFDGDLIPDCVDTDDDGDGDPDTTDCVDDDAAIYTGAPELCDTIDSDCDASLVDEFADTDADGEPDCVDADTDTDADGDPNLTDCDDSDPAVYTGAPESCDGVDSDCDGSLVDEFVDTDGDDTPNCTDGDDDNDGVLDGLDGDPLDPDVCADVDGDTCDDCSVGSDDFGPAPDNLPASDGTDTDGDGLCNDGDTDDAVYSGAPEVCDNGVDDDCNPATLDVGDGDGDGWSCDVDCDDADVALTDCSLLDTTVQGVGLITLPAGTFEMGCTSNQSGCGSDESPVHTVTLTHAFWLGETEVTQGQWQDLMLNNPSSFGSCGVGCPLETVNWYEALAFANAVSDAESVPECYALSDCNTNTPGNDLECATVTVDTPSGSVYDCAGYRLPTEAEWEYAARAGTDLLYAGSDTASDVAWYDDNALSTTHLAATQNANGWGLYDLSGNVWEWTWDWYEDDYYASGPATDPAGAASGSNHTVRGSAWSYDVSFARVANRSNNPAGVRYSHLGFRLARTAP